MIAPGDDYDDDVAAAEHALGVGDATARSNAMRRMRTDPAFARLVASWEEWLHPLGDGVASAAPPPAVRERLAGQLFRSLETASAAPAMTPLGRFWRPLALVFALLLLASAAMNGALLATWPAPTGGQLLVTLEPAEGGASFVAVYRTDSHAMQLRPISAASDPEHDHELWLIPDGAAPISLGLLSAADRTTIDVPAALAPLVREGATLAVSREPKGGAPGGQPTGPIVSSGSAEQI